MPAVDVLIATLKDGFSFGQDNLIANDAGNARD